MEGSRLIIKPITFHYLTAVILVLGSALATAAPSQTPPDRDVLVFTDGEELIGQMQRGDSQSVAFKSDMAGLLTIEWKKIEQLRTADNFVVVRKGTKLVWRGKYPNVLKGEISATNGELNVQPAAQTAASKVPVADTEAVVPEADFDKAVSYRPNLFEDWKGSASLGISLVNATQMGQTYTSAVHLTRLLPVENWLQPSSRTILTFTSSYGNLSQPGSPTVKTSIFHAMAQRDQYFTPNLYVLVDAGFDHDYSQGLDLQQSYGSGIGWTVVKGPNESFDLKAELAYLDQQFQLSSENQKLFGSIFSEAYDRKLKHVQLHEELSINPAWTNLRAYSATGNVGLTIPVFKRIGFTVSSTDTFLNNPSPGFRKNSYQFSTALTYTLQ
jgi:hypothetical protein